MEENINEIMEETLTTILGKVERIEKGVETIYKMLADKGTVTQNVTPDPAYCNEHGEAMEKGVSKTKFNKDGSPKTYLFHKVDGKMCFGKGVVGS